MTDNDTLSDSLFERIRKLWAKGESAKTLGPEYEQEALTFLAAAQRLLDKHNLSMSDVEFKLSQSQDPVKMHFVDPEKIGLKKKRQTKTWQTILAAIIAQHHNCYVIEVPKTNGFYLIGRRANRQICEYVYTVLAKTVEDVSQQMYVKRFYECRDQLNDVTLARGYKQSFIDGFVVRIHTRYEEETRRLDREHSQAQRATAVLRLSQEKSLVKAFVEALEKKGEIKDAAPKKDSEKDVNMLGYHDGVAAANKSQLSQTGLDSGTGKPVKQLSGG